MSRWLEMARAAEKPSVPFANIAKNAKNPEMHEQRVPKPNIGNNGKRQKGSHGPSLHPAQWDEADFKAFYEERAAILEYDGEHARCEAERLAFETTVIHWMNVTPPMSLDDDHCAQCGESVGRIGPDAVPMLTGAGRHVWLHHDCHGAWMARRRQEAAEALGSMGITQVRQMDEG